MTAQLDFTAALDARPADLAPHVCGDCRHHMATGAMFNGRPTYRCSNLKGFGGGDGIRADFPITAHGWKCWEARA